MASRPETAPDRPTAELLERLREGKRCLRDARRSLSLKEKVRQVIELQRLSYPLLAKRGELEPWKRPWEIEP